MRKIALLLTLVVSAAGCGTDSYSRSAVGRVAWSFPEKVPVWVVSGKQHDTNNFYFSGAGEGATEGEAKNRAEKDALSKLGQYIGVDIQVESIVTELGRAGQSGTIETQVKNTSHVMSWSKAHAQETESEWYVRKLVDGDRVWFEAKSLLRVPKWVVDEQIEENEERREKDKKITSQIESWEEDSVKKTLANAKNRNLITIKVSAAGDVSRGRLAAEENARINARNKAWLALAERTHGVAIQAKRTDAPGPIMDTRIVTSGSVKGTVVSEHVQWEKGVPVATVVLIGEAANGQISRD